MIWFTLALFVVSFIATALLAPKPNIENARAQNLEDASFPRATEDAPIPLVLGKGLMKAPNTIWYGDFSAIPIREKIKTGLFSSKRVTVGYRYFLGLDLALCMGPGVVLREIFVDDKSAWSGTAGPGKTSITGIELNLGGYKKGGFFRSNAEFYSGEFNLTDQPVDTYLESQVGSGNVPAYLGACRLVLTKAELGESASLKKMSFLLENYTDSLGLPNNGKVGEDMNPAEAIYQIMTNSWRGMGVAATDIDTASLVEIGTTLHTEENGVSVVVTAETNGSNLIQEILRQIDGVAYQDPETGKITFDLIREDYVVDDLPVYDEDDIVKIINFSRTSWDEVISQVKISYSSRESDSSRVAISQDMAIAGMIGRLRSTTLSMPFCYEPPLANKIASRERGQLSVPLFRMSIEFNRRAHTLRPGMVFKLSWQEFGISELVLRVQKFDFGQLTKGRIVAECLQDIFAVDDVVFSDPASSSWVAPVVEPQDISSFEILEMPRFFAQKIEFPKSDGEVAVLPVPLNPGGASSGFDLLKGVSTGDLEIREPEEAIYPPTGTLVSDYNISAGFSTGRDTNIGFTLENVNGTFIPADDLASVRTGEAGLLYVNGEWMSFESLTDNLDGTFTFNNIQRGLLGSSPKTHISGENVLQIVPEHFGLGTLDLNEDDTLYYKLLDRVGSFVREENEVSENSQVLNDYVANRPLRPRNLQLDGNRNTPFLIDDSVDHDLTWIASDRNVTLITLENDPAETPDQAETYDVDVVINGVVEASISDTSVTSPHTIPFSLLSSGYDPNAEVRLKSRRTVGDLRESFYYGVYPIQIAFDEFGKELLSNTDWSTGDDTDWSGISGFVVETIAAAEVRHTGYNGLNPNSNTHVLSGISSSTAEIYQDVDVSVYSTEIDANLCSLDWGSRSISTFGDGDHIRTQIEFYSDNPATTLISSFDSGDPGARSANVLYRTAGLDLKVPANTRTIRFKIYGAREAGTVLSAINYENFMRINGISAHRYWRLIGTVAGSYDGGALSEIEFYDTIGGADQANGGVASAGSEDFGGTAAQAFDGTTAMWAGAPGAVAAGTSWVAYDFGAGNDIEIVQVGITARSSGDSNQVWDEFKLQFSDNGTSWVDAQTWSDTSTWGSLQQKKFTV